MPVVGEVESFPVEDAPVGPRPRTRERSCDGYAGFAQLLGEGFDLTWRRRPPHQPRDSQLFNDRKLVDGVCRD